MPIGRRCIRRDGVQLNSIFYWSDVLHTWIGTEEPMIIRYDPRDLSRIYLLAPDGVYYDLSYRDVRRPSIGLWEHRLALAILRKEGRSKVDEEAIFRTIDRMRSITEQALFTTKTVRRHAERRRQLPALRSVTVTTLSDSTGGSPDPPAPVADRPRASPFPVEEW